MKKEEKERNEKIKNQEESFSNVESGSDEYGFEYDFFIAASENVEKKLTKIQPIQKLKKEDKTNQSKTFFLPDFFGNED